MAREDFDAWVATEYTGPALTRISEVSAVERLFRKVPMGTDATRIPRSGGISVTTARAKGVAFPESAATDDTVLLEAYMIPAAVRVAREELRDASYANILNVKSVEAASEVAVALDNAVLGTTGAQNGTTRPYTSLYKTLRTSASPYTADDNYMATASAANVSYTNLSELKSRVEASRYYSDRDSVIIAHPAFKQQFRELLDDSGRPIFNEYAALGAPGGQTLMGTPIVFSHGARASTTMSNDPTGNPLLFVGSAQQSLLGTIGGWESESSLEAGFMTHEVLTKFWIRRAFSLVQPSSWAVLELTA